MPNASRKEFRPTTCKHCGHANKFGRYRCSFCSRGLPVWNTVAFWVVLLIVLGMIAVMI